jgi:uncharacterized protein (UPF0276 family)
MARDVAEIPVLGSGLGYRRELKDAIFRSREAIDFLEIITEQFLGDPALVRELEYLCQTFPVIPHGIGLSVGSKTLDPVYLEGIRRISDIAAAPYYSEHLAMTRAPGVEIGHLSPLWFTETILRVTTDNVHRVQGLLDKPLVLENVTYAFEIPGAGMTQAEFFTRLVEATGCGVLLDVTNLYINSENHGFDPVGFLKQMPLDRVVQVHLAGGYEADGVKIDSHSEPVEEGSWQLLETLAELTSVKGSIVERDANFPEEIGSLLEQVARAREILSCSRGGAARGTGDEAVRCR